MKLFFKTRSNILSLSSFMHEKGVQEGPIAFIIEQFEAFKKQPARISQDPFEDRAVKVVVEKGLIPFVIQQFEAYARKLDQLPQNPFEIKDIEEFDVDLAI